MLRSSFCTGLCRFISSLALLRTLAARYMLSLAFVLLEAVVCFVRVFVQVFVDYYLQLNLCRALGINIFFVAASSVLVLSSAFDCRCFRRRSIVSAFVGI